MLSVNHTSTPIVRLALMRREMMEHKKILYITDIPEDIFMMRSFARDIVGQNWTEITGLGEFWDMLERSEGYYFCSSDILRYEGNLIHLERGSSWDIVRGNTVTEEECINRLIDLGYTHGDATDTPGTYNKSGGTLTIRDALLDRRVSCEWFDTELDSIILYEGDRRNHIAHIRMNKTPDSIALTHSERLNPVLLNLLKGKIDENSKSGVRGEGTIGTKTKAISYDEQGEEEGVGLPLDAFGTFGNKSTGDKLGSMQNEEQGTDSHLRENGKNTQLSHPREGQKLHNRPKIIISGCDFLQDKSSLLELADIHMGGFVTTGGISVEGSIPDITSLSEFSELLKQEQNIEIYTRYPRTVEDFLEYNSITGVPIHEVSSARLTSGTWTIDNIRHTLIADDILGQIFVKKRVKKSIAKHLDLLLSLSPGDYVVHREHGIALFHSVVKKTLSEIEREYIELHYAEGDKLFVPLTEIYRISRYIGENNPELTRLSGTEWERTMDKTNEEIEAIAQDILETSAKRSLAKGRAFGTFPLEEKKFQEAFAYEYTLDQKTAIDEIFADMESENPMDRLISGDVGFGKTEVAMNAIYKAVLSGTQVAVLSPLLVLADEHYETFCARLAPFGVRVGVLTRMSTPSEIKNTLDAIKNGTIDVVVGTHRLISDDVTWKRLGLLIIDEEHKFGVTHKEKIKKIKANLDILALSATPIPRSLNLALSGLRKISLLTTPPRLKKPIETIVTRWNEGVIREAIMRELERGGQTIIIHNRIRGMESIASELEMIMKSEEGRVKNKKGKEDIDTMRTQGVEPPFQGGMSEGQGGNSVESKYYAHSRKAIPYNRTLLTLAKENRKTGNPVENRFWYDILGSEGVKRYKFTRQKPLLEYIVDFYCAELGIVIELDGESHVENTEYDLKREQELAEYGLEVIRFTNQDIMTRSEGVVEQLVQILKRREQDTVTPLPPFEGGLQTENQVPSTEKHIPRIIITHGQMPAEDIEDRIHAFKKREYDILLTTTIIENGVNFLSANTIIIIDPEEFGLASLHQLRGRVGRKDIAGVCYLLYRKPTLAGDEKERLITIANNTHLGAGFEIAMRDMEIRGAGDVLGIKQAGKSKDVGLTLYFRMLEEKIAELKESRKTRTWTKIELELSYVIPDDYFASEADKLSFYREIENIETLEELEEIESEMIEKNRSEVTKAPTKNRNISNLFLLLGARIILSDYGVTKLSKVGMNYTFDFADGTDGNKIRSFLDRFDKRKNYVLLSMKKVRVETRHYRGIEDFLMSLR